MKAPLWSIASGILVGFLLGAGVTYAAVHYSYQAEAPAQVTVVIGPVIITSELPSGQVGEEYSASLQVAGGVDPYIWEATGLPNSLICSDDGVISGTPIGQVGQFTITAAVTDDFGDTASRELTLTISCKLGDASLDGIVDAGDITTVKRILFEIEEPTPCADVNGDGLVNAGDITAIKIIYFGLM